MLGHLHHLYHLKHILGISYASLKEQREYVSYGAIIQGSSCFTETQQESPQGPDLYCMRQMS